MIHIAKLGKFVGKRLNSVSEALKEGDTVKVEVVSFTKQGKIDLKLLEKLTGEPIEKAPEGEWQEDRPARGERRPHSDRNSRPRRDRGDKGEKGDKSDK